MQTVAAHISGYTYGTETVATSPMSLRDLALLKQAAGFTEEDERALQTAGVVLAGQTAEIVGRWRGVLSAVPELAQYSLGPNGQPDPHYSGESGLRFQQWILDTCLRAYDQHWLNYQQEIALRHTSLKKNTTDGAHSAPFIPLRYILAFAAVINETIRPFLAAHGHTDDQVNTMHRAWCKAVHLQIALWSEPYTNPALALGEW